MKRFWGFIKGILLVGETSNPTDNQEGSIWYNSTDDRFRGYAESAVREFVTEDQVQTLSNKSFDNSSVVTVQDDNFTIQDDADNTKQAQFQASGITAGQTRTFTFPDASTTLVGTAATQTLENKTIDGTSATGNNIVLTDADDVSYDNATSGLTATDVQAAIDEVEGRIDSVETDKLEGPGTHGDNVVLRTDGTNTNVMQVSGVIIDDSNDVTGINSLTTTGDVIVGGDLTVNGTTTTINTQTLDVEDANITVNFGGNDASAEGSGLTVDRTGTSGSFVYENALTSKFKLGALGSEVEVADVSSAQVFTNKDMGDDSNVITNASADSFTRETGAQQIVTIPNTAAPDNFVLEDFVQALTNKDYDGGTASNTSRITLPQDTKANLDALTRKEGTVVYANDQDTVYYDNGTKLIPVGTGGELNFYSDGDAEVASTGDFSTGNNTVFDGGGTLAGTFSISSTAADIINGERTFKYVQSATAGDNDDDYIASPAIPIPPGYRGRLLALSFQYRTNASSGNIKFVVEDNTNSAILSDPLDTLDSFDNDFAAQYQVAFFCPADCEEIKVGPQVITGQANAYLLWDDVKVNIDVAPIKDVNEVTEWTSFTPTGSFVTNTTYTGRYKRNGPNMDIQYRLAFAGAPTATTLTVNIPSGFTVDTTNLLRHTENNTKHIGTGSLRDNGTATYGLIGLWNNTNINVIYNLSPVAVLTQAAPITIASGDSIELNVSVPILGWAASAEHVVTPAKSNMSDPVAYTPTFTGWGTTSNVAFTYARIGQYIQILGRFTAGTTTAVEHRISLPSGLTTADSTILGSNLRSVGILNFASLTASSGYILAEPSVTYMTVSIQDTNTNGLTKFSSANLPDSVDYTVNALIPISGWTSDAVFLAAVPIPLTVYLKDVKATGTSGGTFTSGAWQTRTLNTVEGDSSIVSLSSNQFTLQPGKYEIEVSAPCYFVDGSKLKLRNITDSTDTIIGDAMGGSSAGANITPVNRLVGQVTLTSTKVFEIQHRGSVTKATNGFGLPAGFSVDEIYTQVKITKVK